MSHKELLQALSSMLDEKLKPIYQKFDIQDIKQDHALQELDKLQINVKISELNIIRELHTLQDGLSIITRMVKPDNKVLL